MTTTRTIRRNADTFEIEINGATRARVQRAPSGLWGVSVADGDLATERGRLVGFFPSKGKGLDVARAELH